MTGCKLQALKCQLLPELQKELLAKDANLTLDQALNIGRTHEASTSHMLQLRGMQSATDLHSITTVNKSICHSCGRSHHTKERCPAHGSTCRKCSGKNIGKPFARNVVMATGNHDPGREAGMTKEHSNDGST